MSFAVALIGLLFMAASLATRHDVGLILLLGGAALTLGSCAGAFL